MKSRPGWLVPAVVLVMVGVLGLVAAGYNARGPLSALGVTVSELQPQSVGLLGPAGDPLVVMIGVRWTEDGYCVGQLTVQATETPTEVRVGNVINREVRLGDCAGVGTANNTAWADLRLTSPLGDRAVVRESDGARLPVSVL